MRARDGELHSPRSHRPMTFAVRARHSSCSDAVVLLKRAMQRKSSNRRMSFHVCDRIQGMAASYRRLTKHTISPRVLSYYFVVGCWISTACGQLGLAAGLQPASCRYDNSPTRGGISGQCPENRRRSLICPVLSPRRRTLWPSACQALALQARFQPPASSSSIASTKCWPLAAGSTAGLRLRLFRP